MRFTTFLMLIAIVAAYVFGARAGRERYEQIVGAVSSSWNDPKAKKARKKLKKATR